MKKLLQNMKNGTSEVKDIPIPRPAQGMALVQTAYSLVSAGTEKMLVELLRKNIFEKAASRPDLVKQVLDKANEKERRNTKPQYSYLTRSPRPPQLPTLESAFHRLDQPL
jgi:hypothetical protein